MFYSSVGFKVVQGTFLNVYKSNKLVQNQMYFARWVIRQDA